MRSHRFGPFVLEVQERRLLRNGTPIALTPKAFDTLVFLVERHGRLVDKDELIEAVWGDAHVEEGNLSRIIHVLRKALNPDEDDPATHRQFIETVPTKGYRFVADVTNGGEQPSETLWRRAVIAAAVLLLVAVAATAFRLFSREDTAPEPEVQRRTAPTSNGAAFAKFQSGRLLLDRHHAGDVEHALREFEAAIALDPSFAAAHAGKADAKFFSYWDTGAHDDIVQARLAIRKAIDTDRDDAYAHAVQCRLLATYEWEFAEAESECRRAVALDPHNHQARRELAFLLSSIGKRREALVEIDEAIVLAPTSVNKRSRGVILYFDRKFDEAIDQLKQVEATDPEYVDSSRWITRALEQKRDYAQALEFLIRFRESAGSRPEEIASLRQAFSTGGWPGVLRASRSQGRAAVNLDAAGTLAQLGELDAAFTVLESMISERRVMIVHLDSEPRLDPLRADHRFQRLASRVGVRQP